MYIDPGPDKALNQRGGTLMVVRKANASVELTFADVVGRASGGYKTVGQMAYDIIRECIITGVLAPGEHLRQEELAERIGVSRIPIRTALMQLESEGLVSFHPHKGAVVRTLTVEQVREIYELRVLLETYALRKSIARMTSARAARLRELGTALDEPHISASLVDERVAFYRELYDAGENPTTVEIIEDLRNSVGRYLLGLRVDHGAGGHRELARLASRGDADTAAAHLRDHLEHVSRRIIEVLSSEEAEADPVTPKRRRKKPAPA
ncbi:GntR family transcriptional regulator [Sinosporangium siamense]|uniref:GntR family transcriptional regulator n=1 Tax=Sinosporangium siamense TaxID=1367973 RepID=A0A919RAU1_9ACTN|nr:GntR family transcriptional regulator [Sinosporangium siamense]GII90546.1 GntR family transcriptional regulator [Sinosporangium siamense]